MPFFDFLNDDATAIDIIMADLERYGPMVPTVDHIMTKHSPLSRAERELIAAFVSGLNGCQYCYGAHTVYAESHGVNPTLFESLLRDVHGAGVDEKLEPILHFVKKLTLLPHRLVQADADAVFEAGWPQEALGDAIAVCALFSFFNRLVDGHGIKAQSIDINRADAEIVKKHGYTIDTNTTTDA